ncbi:carbohydrate-binding protein [Aetokthonos hydrillicola Thurmond2011]|jgi:hypothetical protein|uniref:Carbohydrate-binding protein n=1 Tax=Aetokthonos hydrillicola Thurmond2011 TaxID=2712845 RepID=A0AAP5IHN3_9CYAN|nr:carbohydrate-binding protein [Aetokthonos hydrillicola]MBO3460108.1 carbohydrate-binding protein [Aetokthonos hydrillicola CCALA 1050]MBW4590740.1 carbohydrate-binding protein [Aetokthonos hydrillicola CCALA 1050]MDR9899790.1 carbohydrate-binding protein [Aetokthonos hydrillicola Thurmond2011]
MISTSADSMTLKNRTELKSLFKNNTHLSANHFVYLINSLLNKREDKFHGVWKSKQAYQPGDVVYYDGALWEMKMTHEICAKTDEEPGKGDQWKSSLKELEHRVDKLQQDLATLRKEFTDCKQKMELCWKQLLRLIALLLLGVAIAFVWLFASLIYHLLTGAA